MNFKHSAKAATKTTWDWARSDRGLLIWAVMVGAAAGLLSVVMKQSVGGLRGLIFSIQEWVGGTWILALGPVVGLLATSWVVRTVLNGDHPGPGIPSTLHAISTNRGRMKRKWMIAPVFTSVLSVGWRIRWVEALGAGWRGHGF